MGDLFITSLKTNPPFFFAVVITVVLSICLHELAHGWAALALGDDTPRVSGHMTLNPVVHMGLTSIALLAIAGIAFGMMPVDWRRMRGKYAEAIVALAGPAMNLLLALLTLSGLALWQRFSPTPFDQLSPVAINGKYLLLVFGMINLALLMFNLIPLPPLDGSHVLANVVPAYRRFLSQDLARGIMGALFFAMFLGAGNFIQSWALDGTMQYLKQVSGRPEIEFHEIGARQSFHITDDETSRG